MSDWLIYVDGADVTATLGMPDTADTLDDLWIGADPLLGFDPVTYASFYFIGDMAEFAVYASVLSSARVAAHYAAADDAAYIAAVETDTPLAWWRLSETSVADPALDALGDNPGAYSSGCTFPNAGPFLSSCVNVDAGEHVAILGGYSLLQLANFAQSWELWFKRGETSGDWRSLFGKGGVPAWAILNESQVAVGAGGYAAEGYAAASSVSVADTNWHHLVITKSGDPRPSDTDPTGGINVGTTTQLAGVTRDYLGIANPTGAQTAATLRAVIGLLVPVALEQAISDAAGVAAVDDVKAAHPWNVVPAAEVATVTVTAYDAVAGGPRTVAVPAAATATATAYNAEVRSVDG